MYLDAVIAVEDRRFYYHPGIDIISIGRAVLTDIREMKLVEGGSTITVSYTHLDVYKRQVGAPS